MVYHSCTFHNIVMPSKVTILLLLFSVGRFRRGLDRAVLAKVQCAQQTAEAVHFYLIVEIHCKVCCFSAS